MKYDYLIVGAGFAGSVLAERLARKLNKKVLIIDKRDHIGGNCYDYSTKDKLLIQKYGPHIFHTNNKVVWNYLSKFTELNDYKHRVMAVYKNEYYPIPINLETVNKFYKLKLNSKRQLREFLKTKRIKIGKIKNSRDVIVSKYGIELYDAFIKEYTKKQWGKYPEELHKEVLERIQIREDKNPYYFNAKFQGMPMNGFTKIFEKMLEHKNIDILLKTDFFKVKDKLEYENLVYTGRIDELFRFKFGKLKFRQVEFVFETYDREDYQQNSVINHPSNETPYLRTTEFKKFYNSQLPKTIICKEYFGQVGEECYPIMDSENKKLLKKYTQEAKKMENTFFVGRLAQYKYLDIDQVIFEALKTFDRITSSN